MVGCGDKYSKQGRELSKRINEHLIETGICSTIKECHAQLETYVDHDTRVNFSIYNPNNRKALAAFIEYVIEYGIQITDGIPISIKVYPESRQSYGNFIIPPKSIIKVEVSK
jgi:hypothetical protein